MKWPITKFDWIFITTVAFPQLPNSREFFCRRRKESVHLADLEEALAVGRAALESRGEQLKNTPEETRKPLHQFLDGWILGERHLFFLHVYKS